MKELLNIHSVIERSRVNGPGERLVVFTQGCAHGCGGCFNSALHPYGGGFQINPEELLKKYISGPLEGITVSGGEPFDQPLALKNLLKAAKEKYDYTCVVYTGYGYADLACGGLTRECLSFIDVLIDGRFNEKKKETTLLARGSTNQEIMLLTGRYEEKDLYMPGKVEITIGPDGTVTSTGFSDPGFEIKDAV